MPPQCLEGFVDNHPNDMTEDYIQSHTRTVRFGAIGALKAKESAAKNNSDICCCVSAFFYICIILFAILVILRDVLPEHWFSISVLMLMFSAFYAIAFFFSALQEAKDIKYFNELCAKLEPPSQGQRTIQRPEVNDTIHRQIPNVLNVARQKRNLPATEQRSQGGDSVDR